MKSLRIASAIGLLGLSLAACGARDSPVSDNAVADSREKVAAEEADPAAEFVFTDDRPFPWPLEIRPEIKQAFEAKLAECGADMSGEGPFGFTTMEQLESSLAGDDISAATAYYIADESRDEPGTVTTSSNLGGSVLVTVEGCVAEAKRLFYASDEDFIAGSGLEAEMDELRHSARMATEDESMTADVEACYAAKGVSESSFGSAVLRDRLACRQEVNSVERLMPEFTR